MNKIFKGMICAGCAITLMGGVAVFGACGNGSGNGEDDIT